MLLQLFTTALLIDTIIQIDPLVSLFVVLHISLFENRNTSYRSKSERLKYYFRQHFYLMMSCRSFSIPFLLFFHLYYNLNIATSLTLFVILYVFIWLWKNITHVEKCMLRLLFHVVFIWYNHTNPSLYPLIFPRFFINILI